MAHLELQRSVPGATLGAQPAPGPGGDVQGHHERVRFRVVRWSSAADGYSGTALERPDAKSRGWQSTRWCDYPQELVFALDGAVPADISRVQVLSHQSKISTRIEFFVSEVSWERTEQDPAHYKRVGFFTLQDNSATDYRARELKDINVRVRARVVRLLLHRNYVNPINVYGQIGVIALNIMGPRTSRGSFADVAFDVQLDPKTLQQLRDLHIAKQRAVSLEDYDEAKGIKDRMQRLKLLGAQLAQLEAQKRVAVVNEEYDVAKQLKQKIEHLRMGVQAHEPPSLAVAPILRTPSPSVPHGSPSPQYARISTVLSNEGERTALGQSCADGFPEDGDQRYAPADAGSGRSPVHSQHAANKWMLPYDERPLPALEKKRSVDLNENGMNPFGSRFAQNKTPPRVPAIDDEEAMRRSGGSVAGSVSVVGDEDLPTLSDVDRSEASELIATFDEDMARGLYSKSWNHRDAVVGRLLNSVGDAAESGDGNRASAVFSSCVFVLRRTLTDPIAQVSMHSLGVLEFCVKKLSTRIQKPQFHGGLDLLLPLLLERLGSRTGTRPYLKAKGIASSLATSPHVGVSVLARHLLAPLRQYVAGNPILSRVELITEMLETHGVNEQQLGQSPTNIVKNFALPALQHKQVEVREAGVRLAVLLYRALGEKVMAPLLRDLNQTLKHALEKEFGNVPKDRDVDSLDHVQQSIKHEASIGAESRPQKSETRHGSVSPVRQISAGARLHTGEVDDADNDFDDVDESVCRFCGIHDDSFLKEELLDLHYWRNCPMLVSCKLCEQVVEIPTLFEHLLHECEASADVAVCSKCQQPFVLEDIDSHRCVKRPPVAQGNRCPLCLNDIGPGDEGWRAHILVSPGCPKNSRNEDYFGRR